MKGLGLLPRATIGVSRWRRFRAAVDWPLIVTMVLLCTIGLLNLYSATRGVRHHAKFDTQVQWMIVGGIGFIIATVIDYRAFVRLGLKMLHEALSSEPDEAEAPNSDPFSARSMALLALATSIDALAVGVTLPLLEAPVVLSLISIGVVTAVMSALGLYAGRRFGAALGRRVDAMGGLILIGLGVKILVEHLAA